MPLLRTLSDLRTDVRDILDESTASFWTNAQLNRYITLSMDRVWMRVRSLNDDYFNITRLSTDGNLTILSSTYTASNFEIQSGTRQYTLPPDFSEMKLVEVLESGYEDVTFTYKDIAHPDHRAARSITTNQAPAEFYFDIIGERTMDVAPLSDRVLDLRITYVQIPAILTTDTQSLTMPHPLYLAVEQYAAALALRQDRNPDAAVAKADGDSLIAEMFGAHHRQTQDPETVRSYLDTWTGW